ncbi:MAG: low affinity iron permease family protein [Bacteroidetes bacterium]|nr:low affinity iron permease family protein [Bacteroidota bacterium]
MKNKTQKTADHSIFEKLALKVTQATGSTSAFLIAALIVVIWLVTGPIFNYSDTWQLVINTGTTIVTFLMVFLIQKSQNKDAIAIQLKLNELVAAHEMASNRLVSVEDMTEPELRTLQKYYSKLAALTSKEENLQASHSIEEAEEIHKLKKDIKDKPAKTLKNKKSFR